MANEDSLQSLFDQAQKELAANDFAAAVVSLKKIKESGYTSGSVEASLGRALFEGGDAGQALAAWNRAIALDRFNSTYRTDLELALSKVAGNVATRLEHPAEFANRMASYVRPAEIFFLGALLLVACIWVWLSGIIGNISRFIRIVAVIAVVILVAAGVFGLSSRSLAVVTTKTSLKPAPLESADGSLELASGTRVRILKKSGDYLEIERPNSFRGWVNQNTVEASPF